MSDTWLCGAAELVSDTWLASRYAGHGVRGDAIPTSGTDGPSPLLDAVTLPADAAVEVRLLVTRWPTLGVLALAEDGSFDYAGASDYFEGRLYADGVALTADIGFGPGIARVVLNVGDLGAFSGALVCDDATVGGSFASAGPSAFIGALLSADAAVAGLFQTPAYVPVGRSGRIVIGILYERKASTMTVATEVTAIDVDARGEELKFDFADELPLGVTVTSAEIEVELLEGSHATPAAILNGTPRLANGNTMVLQDVDGKVAPVSYSVRCLATCSDNDVRPLVIHLPVRAF